MMMMMMMSIIVMMMRRRVNTGSHCDITDFCNTSPNVLLWQPSSVMINNKPSTGPYIITAPHPALPPRPALVSSRLWAHLFVQSVPESHRSCTWAARRFLSSKVRPDSSIWAEKSARRTRTPTRRRTRTRRMSRAEEREDADCVCSVGMKFTWDINDPKLPQVTLNSQKHVESRVQIPVLG